jgi:hypothetical protein
VKAPVGIDLICPTINPTMSTVMNTNTTEYNNADEAYDAGQKWIKESDRFEKLDFLMETTSQEFKDNLLNEIARWMGEHDWEEFFNHLVRNWEIKTPQELDYEMNN